jgi:hypothetical protein
MTEAWPDVVHVCTPSAAVLVAADQARELEDADMALPA